MRKLKGCQLCPDVPVGWSRCPDVPSRAACSLSSHSTVICYRSAPVMAARRAPATKPLLGVVGSRSRAPDVPAARSSAQAHELQRHPREQQQRPGTQGLRCALRCSCVSCHHVPHIATFLVSPCSWAHSDVFRARSPWMNFPALSGGGRGQELSAGRGADGGSALSRSAGGAPGALRAACRSSDPRP